VLFVVATQENRQADYTRQTENNLPGNQQGVLFPPSSIPIWYPEGWWGYYPVQYNAQFNESANETDKHSYLPYTYPPYPDGRAYVAYESFYPIYNQNLTDVTQTNVESPGQYSYVTMYPQMNYDDPGVQQLPVRYTNNSNHSHDRFTAATDLPFIQNDMSREHLIRNDTVAGIDNTLLNNEINHLDALGSPSSGTCNSTRNVCPDENCNNETNGMITAMNIIDEEDGASDNTRRSERERSGKTLDLHINVPNYTYVDTSDSSESGDSSDSSDCNDSRNSSDSTSDNEHLSDSCRRDQIDDTTSNNTSSDSDSDSYLAYSTGLNPYEKLEEDPDIFSGISHIDATDITDTCPNSSGNADDGECDSADDSESSICSEKSFEKNHINCTNDYLNPRKQNIITNIISERNIDLQSDEINPIDRKMGYHDQDNTASDNTPSMIPHQLSVIYENMERSDSESPYCENKKKIDGLNEASFEGIDEPPDDDETTMVSVSLPLKFKFFVSEDNEDITTVTIGDSRIKEEKSCDIKNEYPMRDAGDKTDDVHVNFHVGNDTTVDFTLVKRHVSNDDARTIANTTPHVDFTLRRDFSPTFDFREDNEISYEKQNGEENLQATEINEIKCDETNQHAESMSSNDDDHTVSESITTTQDICELNDVSRQHSQISQEVCNNFENLNLEEERMIAEPEVATPECFWILEGQTPRLQIVDANSSRSDTSDRQYSTIMNDKEENRRIDSEFCQIDGKHLLNVDNREDTDDEDSGVTSDLSRMISEVDTDSECASSKNLKRYQRTQTHSRLFRLLNDDSVLTCSDCLKIDSPCKKEYLSLPLKPPNAFNYDDSYCSNYSSGLTSPEYSPVLEQSWRKFYEPSSEGIASSPNLAADHAACQSEQPSYKNDPYFRAWKNSKSHPGLQDNNVLPSLAFKILDSRMPSWAYKVNVLCPRIKSTKNVPQTLLSAYPARQPGEINDPLPAVILPIPTSCTNANTDYC
jgi:hypothetical protein